MSCFLSKLRQNETLHSTPSTSFPANIVFEIMQRLQSAPDKSPCLLERIAHRKVAWRQTETLGAHDLFLRALDTIWRSIVVPK